MHVTDLATGLCQSLLTIGGKTRSEKLPTNLNKLVRSSMKIIRRTLPSAIEVKLTIPRSPVAWCNLDVSQLQQLLMNLVVNARDAMPDGGVVRVSVEPDFDSNPPCAYVRVSDTGGGIAPEIRSRIFEPFVSSKPRGRGTGLGLSIAHAVVTDHGGTIDVQSEPNRGTEFVISFPMIDAPNSDESEHTPSGDFQMDSVNGIAIVADDQAHVRKSIVTSLQVLGYEAITASDGRDCFERVQQLANVLDLVILDVDMPIMNGLDCLERIRKICPKLKVVLITGMVTDSLDGLTDDFTNVLRKPFSLASLADSVSFNKA